QGNLFRLPREVDLQRHLVNGNFAEEEETAAEEDENKVEPKMFEFGGDDDYQLKQAINFLEGRPVKKNDPSLVAKTATPEGKDGKAPAAEKKSPVNPADSKIERFRITPDGVVPAQ